MFKAQKLLAVLCLMACLVNIQVPMAMAYETAENDIDESMPFMTYITDAGCKLSIKDGYANIYAYVKGRSSTATECEIVVELQEKSLLSWNTVHTWDKTVDGYEAESDVMKRVTAGNSYRAVATVTVWSGTASESQTLISDTIRS